MNRRATIDSRARSLSALAGSIDPAMRGALARLRLERPNDEAGQVIGVTACAPGAGATWVAAQLAAAAAAQGEGPALLVETQASCDWLRQSLGFEPGGGLAEWAHGHGSLTELLQPCAQPDLWVLPASETPLSCDGGQLQRLGALMREEYPLTVIDLPPQSDLAAAELAAACDGVLLVVRAHHTRWQVAERARRLLQAAQAPVWGVVLNRRRLALPQWLYRLA